MAVGGAGVMGIGWGWVGVGLTASGWMSMCRVSLSISIFMDMSTNAQCHTNHHYLFDKSHNKASGHTTPAPLQG